MVETLDGSEDPATCTELATRRFDEQLTATEGLAAIKTCEKEVREPNGDPSSLAASAIRVQGATASIHLIITGGTLDGQVLEVALIRAESQWKLSEIRGFAELDRPKFIAAFMQSFSTGTDAPAQTTACVQTALAKAPQSQLEVLLFSGSTEAIRQLYALCTERARPSLE